MQILVVVANNLTRSRMAEAEKGSVRTALAHGSVGPERRANAVRLWTSSIHSEHSHIYVYALRA